MRLGCLCASGVAIENLAAEDVEKLAAPFKHRAQNAGSKTSPDGLLPGVERARGQRSRGQRRFRHRIVERLDRSERRQLDVGRCPGEKTEPPPGAEWGLSLARSRVGGADERSAHR